MSYYLQGLGALGASTPTSGSNEVPKGLSAKSIALGKGSVYDLSKVSSTDRGIAELCNMSAQPAMCFTAKRDGVMLLGRGENADIGRWADWVPGTGVDLKTGNPISVTAGDDSVAANVTDEPMSDTMFYGLIGLGVLAAGVGGYFILKHLPMSWISGLSFQPTKVTPYKGVSETVSVMKKHLLGARGSLSPKVRFLTEYVCETVSPKDYLSEALAIRYFVLQKVPYFRDPTTVEWVRDPEALVDQIKTSQNGIVRADCDEITCLCAAMWMCAGNDVDIVTVGFSDEPEAYSHVFVRCKIPKTDPPAYIVCDPVAGTKEASMLTKIKQYKIIPVE